jgi:hypothetical protein
MKENIKLFEEKKIRAVWDEEKEEWYFSIVDVIEVLTGSPNPQVYWRVLKKRLRDEGNESVTNCNGLKMLAPDGKMRLTDVADTQQLQKGFSATNMKNMRLFYEAWNSIFPNRPLVTDDLQNIDYNQFRSVILNRQLSTDDFKTNEMNIIRYENNRCQDRMV